MTKTIVIGAGRMAKEHLKCLKTLPDVEIVGVADLSAAKAELAADRFSVPCWSTSYKEILEKTSPDVAHIVTDASSHFKIAKDLLNAGVSVFIEKPIADSFQHFKELTNLAENKGLFLQENYNYLFTKPVLRLLEASRQQAFGEIQHLAIHLCVDFQIDRSVPSDYVMREFVTHFVSLCHLFMGVQKKIMMLWKKDGNDFSALVEAEKGNASIYFTRNVHPEGFFVDLFGAKMRASMNLFESRLCFAKEHSLPRPISHFFNGLIESGNAFSNSFQSLWGKLKGNPSWYSGMQELLLRFYRAMKTGEALPISKEQMREVNQAVFEILGS